MNLTTRARIQGLTQRASALDRALTLQMQRQDLLAQPSAGRRWLMGAARIFTAVFALQTALAAGPVLAQVTAAPGAPAGQRPLIDAAANGVPIVHIAPPSTAGVSRNQYNQFNVQGNGLILNNSKGSVQTQQGGWITGNLQLGATPARIILNEVVGSGASQLRGTIEVAGQRADIVIANPNGISCDGCGFLNTAGRASLVAGQVRTGADGAIDSFDTGTGNIRVGPAGLNAADQEQLDLIARGLVIEGEVWARNINAIAGANKVLYGTLEAAPQGGGAGSPLFAVDIKQLGGMFANQIYMVATEKGLGVNSTGRLAALQGNLALSADGDLTLKDAYAKGEVRLASTGRVATTGEVVADAAMRITAPTRFTNNGAVQAASTLSIASSSISNQGSLAQQSSADFVINAADGLRNDGTIHARGNLRVDAASVRGTGGQLLAGSNLLVQAQTVDLEQPNLVADGDLNVRAGSVRAVGGAAQAGAVLRLDSSGRLDVGGSTLSANAAATLSGTEVFLDRARANVVGNLSVRASAALSAQGAEATSNGVTELVGARIDAGQARLQAQQQLSLQAAGEVALQGAQVISGTSVSIQGQGVSTAFATVSAPAVSVQAGAGRLDNQSGRLLASAPDGVLQVAGRGIDNRDGEIRSNGVLALQAGGGLVDNAGGTIAGRAGDLSDIGGLLNRHGTVHTNADLTLSGAGLDNEGGTIASDGALSINSAGQSIRNTDGTLHAGGALSLDSGAGDIASAGGTLSARGAFSARGSTVDLSGGRLAAGQSASVEARSLLAGGAEIAVDGQLEVAVQGDANLAGASVGAGGDLGVRAANIIATGATIATRGQLQVATGEMRGGIWSADGNLTVNGTGAVNVTGGGFFASGNVTVQAQGLTTDGGRVTGQNIQLDAGGGAFSNVGGAVVATGTQGNSLRVSGQGIRNTGGALVSAGGAVLDANGQTLDNSSGTVQAAGVLQVSASRVLNRGGTLATGNSISLHGHALDNTGGTIMTRGDLSIDTQGLLLDNTGGRLLAQGEAGIAAGELRNAGGMIGANGAATVRADTLDTSSGQITGARALDVLVAQRLRAQGAFLGSEGSAQVTARDIEAQAAVLQAGGGLSVTAVQSFDLTGATVTVAGPQATALELRAQTIQADQATVRGDAAVRVHTAGALAARGARFSSVGTLTLDAQGDLQLDAAQAVANGRMQLAGSTLSADHSVLDTAAQLELAARTGPAALNAARLIAGGTLDVQATGIQAHGADIGAAGNIRLDAGSAELNAADARIRSGAGSITASAAHVNAAASQAPSSGGQPQTGFIARQGLAITATAGGIDFSRAAAVAGTDLALQAQGTVSTQGGIAAAGGRATVVAAALDNRAGTLDSDGALSIAVRQDVDNTAGRIATRDTLVLQGAAGAALQSLANRQGTIESSGSLDLRLDSFDNREGSVLVLGGLVVRGGPVDNRAGVLAARGAVSVDTHGGAFQGARGRVVSEQAGVRVAAAALGLEAAQVLAHGDVELNGTQAQAADATIGSQAGTIAIGLGSGDAVFDNARLLAGGAFRLQAGRTSLGGTRVSSGSATVLTTGALNARQASVDALGDLTVDASGTIDATRATIAAGGAVTITGTQGIALGAGVLSARAIALDAGAGAIGNAAGSITATGSATLALQLAGQGLDNTGGQIRSGGGLVVDARAGAIANSGGNLLAVGTASLRSNGLDNRGGAIAANGDVALVASATDPLAVVHNAGGDIHSAQGSVSLSAGELRNAAQGPGNAGQVAAADDLRLTLAGSVDNTGALISAGRDLRLNAGGGLGNDAGRLVAGRDAAVAAASASNREGLLAANGNLALATGSGGLDNTRGQVQAAGDLDLVSVGDIASERGAIIAGRQLNLTAGALDNRQGQVVARDGGATLALAALDATGGRVQAGTDLTVTSSGVLQGTGAVLSSGGQMLLRAGAADLTDARLAAGASLRAEAGSLQAARLDAQTGGNLALDSGGGALEVQSANLRAAQALSLLGGAVDLRIAQLAANTGVTVRGASIDASGAGMQSPGDISVVAMGTLDFAGARMAAGQDLQARGSGAGTNAGAQLQAGRDLDIATGAFFDFGGPGVGYQVGRDLTVRAEGIRSAGQQVSARHLTLDAGGGLLDNRGGELLASEVLHLRGQGLDNQGGTIAANGDVAVQAGSGAVDNTGGRVYSTQGEVSLAGGAIHNRNGLLSAAADITIEGASLDNSAALVAAGRNLTVELTGALDNSTGARLVANVGSVSVGANGIANTGGTISGATGAAANAGSGTLDNRGGVIVGTTTSATGAQVRNASGVISGLWSTSVSAVSIDNDAGVIEAGAGGLTISAQGRLANTSSGSFRGIVSSGDISISAGGIDNGAGYIGANGTLNIHSGVIDNRMGTITGAGASSVVATGTIDNAGGAITSTGDLTVRAASLNNAGPSVIFARNNLDVAAGHIDNSGTRDGSYLLGLLAGGNLAIDSTTLNNRDGAIVALGDAAVRATGSLDNRGGQIGGNNVTVETPELLNTGGRVDAQQRLVARVQRFSADGIMASNGILELETTGDYTNTGIVAASGDLSVRTTGSYTNLGTVSAQRNLTLSAGNNLTNEAGARIVSQSTTLNVGGTLTNRGLINSSNGATSIHAGTVQNTDRIYGNGMDIRAAVINMAGAVIASRDGAVNIAGSLSNTESSEVLALGDINIRGDVTNRNALINATGNVMIQGDLQNQNAGLTLGTQTRIEAINRLFIIPAGDTTRYDASTLAWRGDSGGHWVLPSTTYPFSSFGADYRAPAVQCSGGGDSGDTCGNTYGVSDPIWALFNVASPGEPPAAPSQTGCLTYNWRDGGYNRDMSGACGGYWGSYDAYQQTLATRYVQLDGAIMAFNTDLDSRSLVDWYEQRTTEREIVSPTVISSQPGRVFAGGSIDVTSATNQDSAIVAGGDVSGNISNLATSGTQTTTENGLIRFSHRDWHGGFRQEYSRDYTAWQPISGGAQSQSVSLDTLNAPRVPPANVANSAAGTAPNAQVPGLGAVAAGVRGVGASAGVVAGIQGGNVAAAAQAVQVANITTSGPGQASVAGPAQTAGTVGVGVALAAGPQTQAAGGSSVNLSGAADTPLAGSVIAAGVRGGQAQAIAAVQASFAAQAPARAVSAVSSEALIARVASPPAIKGAGFTTATAKGPLNAPAGRVFSIHSAPGANYLVETDPEFTDYRRFLSSDWMLAQLNLDPERTMKRYGDGFAEQRLVDEQILALTGRRYLSGYGATQDEYQDLLNAGVMFARDYQLTPGVALSAQQMASLTTDIVWLEKQAVTLADGSTAEALVPRVYLRRPVSGDLTPAGGLVSGASIALRSPAGDITNSGVLYGWGRGGVDIQADNIANSGTVAGASVTLAAQRDVTLAGGQVTGTGTNSAVTVSAGRDIVLQTTTQTSSQGLQGPNGTTQVGRTNVYRIATIAADSITLAALGNIDLQGASIKATGSVGLSAVGAITAGTVLESYSLNAPLSGAGARGRTGHYNMESTTNVGTEITAGASARLNAGGAVNLTGSTVSAADNLTVRAASVSIAAAKDSLSIDQQGVHKDGYQRVGKAGETLSGGTLAGGNDVAIIARGDITATGVALTADKGQASLIAGGDVAIRNATTQHSTLAESYDSNKGLFRTHTKAEASASELTQIERSVVEGNTVLVQAGQVGGDGKLVQGSGNVMVQASAVNAQQGLAVAAGNDVSLTSAQHLASSSSERQESKTATGLGKAIGVVSALHGDSLGAMLGTSKSASRTGKETSSSAVGSTLTGSTVDVSSGRDTVIQGATVIADQDLSVTAGRKLEITSAQSSATGASTAESKTSGFVGTVLQPAVGVVKQNSASQDTRTTQVASNVASLSGNVTLKAADGYTQTASNVAALQGDVGITGKQISINEAQDTATGATQNLYSKVAIGGSVSVPLVDAVRSIGKMADAAGDTGNSRVQALAVANAAMTASSLADSASQLAAGNMTGIKVSVSLGSTKSESESSNQSSSAVGSTVAGRNVSLTATGDGANSNIAVAGSDIKATNNADLNADGQVILQAGTSTAEQHSTNRSDGWSVGVGFAVGGQQNGFTIEASASKARGNADGKDSVYNNSHVTAGNAVGIRSGGDTSLKGAVVAGQTVQADVGGNLNIESLQDTSKFDSKQTSTGVGVSLCIPPICYGMSSASVSASKAKVEGDFASVTEQSGIKAGDGGFQVSVKGNTDLKGGVIASTDKAKDENRNTLTTATLTQSDIRNKDVFNANGYSFGATVSGSMGDQGAATTPADKAAAGQAANAKPGGSMGIGSASGEQNSTTRSGISAGAITITSSEGQKSLTGKDAADTVAGVNREVTTDKGTGGAIQKAWDGDKLMKDVQAQTQITSAFGQAASRQVAEYAQKQYNEAMARKDPVEAAKWAEGGEYRVALHTGVGGLMGGLPAALGAGGSAALMPAVGKLIDDSGAPAPVRQGLGMVAAGAIGAVAGSVVGSGAAFNVDVNNRQLHPTETKWIHDNAKRYALERGISEAEAEKQLAAQAFRQVQFGAAGNWDPDAKAFLARAGQQLLPADPAMPAAGPGFMFYALPEQKAMATMYLGSLVNSPQALQFYQANGITQPTFAQIVQAAGKDARSRGEVLGNTVKAALLAGALVMAPALSGVAAEAAAFLRNPVGYCMGNPAGCTVAADVAATTLAGVPVSGVTIPVSGTRSVVKAAEQVAADAVAVEVAAVRGVGGRGPGAANGANTASPAATPPSPPPAAPPVATPPAVNGPPNIFNNPELRQAAETTFQQDLKVSELAASGGADRTIRGLVDGEPRAAVVADIYGNGKKVDISHVRTEETDLPRGSAGLFIAETLKKGGVASTEQLSLTGIINPEAISAHAAGLGPETTSLGRAGMNALIEMGLQPAAIRFVVDARGKLNIVIDVAKKP